MELVVEETLVGGIGPVVVGLVVFAVLRAQEHDVYVMFLESSHLLLGKVAFPSVHEEQVTLDPPGQLLAYVISHLVERIFHCVPGGRLRDAEGCGYPARKLPVRPSALTSSP